MTLRTRRGFTLVELLVVISIIALLISITLPSLSKAREAARSAACLSGLRQLQMAAEMYADQNNGKYPPRKGTDTDVTPAVETVSIYLWAGHGGENVSGVADFTRFEADERPLTRFLGVQADGESLEITRCPTDDRLWTVTGTSYPVNSKLASDGYNRDAIQRTSNTVIISEAGAYYGATTGGSDPSETVDWDAENPLNQFHIADFFWHHSERWWNVSFADGHAGVIYVDLDAPSVDRLNGDRYTYEVP